MNLDGFKRIYWFEFSHRLLGRVIGIVFLIPFLFFLFKGWVQRPLIAKLTFMFILGGLQGLLGWYMVKSGLVDNPHVSQYRLTAHLGLAVLIYAYMLHVALGLCMVVSKQQPGRTAFKAQPDCLALLSSSPSCPGDLLPASRQALPTIRFR